MYSKKSSTSFVKDIVRAIPLIQIAQVVPQIGKLAKLLSTSLPADCGIFEEGLKSLGVDNLMLERDRTIFAENKDKMEKIGMYTNCSMNFIGDAGGLFKPSIAWADYCGFPTLENMRIAQHVKIGFATFNINSRFVKNGDSVAIKNNPFLKGLKGQDEEGIIKAIKKFYKSRHKQYELITCIRYVSSHESMLLIGFARKSLNFPSKQKEIQEDLSNYYSNKRVLKSDKKMFDLFVKRVYRMGKRVNINVGEYVPNIPQVEKTNKTQMKKVKLVKINKAIDSVRVLKDATRLLYLSGKFSDDEIMQTLGITRMKLAGTKATCKRYKLV